MDKGFPETLASLHNLLLIARRWLLLTLLLVTAVWFLLPIAQQSKWNRTRLYLKLLSDNSDTQLQAASRLVYLGAQEELLRSLQSEKAHARTLGQRGLELLWMRAAGDEAFNMLDTASKSSEDNQPAKAMEELNLLLSKYPNYAEGYNRRAAVCWKMGKYKECITDSERVLKLNPNHYGAWQGLGACYMQAGNLTKAEKCFQTALKLLPHDVPTRGALRECQMLLENYMPPIKPRKAPELVNLSSSTR